MTPITLGARATNAPHPAGKPFRHPCAQAGTTTLPAAGNFIVLDPSSGGSGWQTWWQGQLGPYNLPTRFWLIGGANWIAYPPSTPDWNRFDVGLYLLVAASNYGPDLNGQTYHQNADSMPGAPSSYAQWQGNSIEARFFCEANTTYHLRFLTMSAGAGANAYYQHPSHMNMWAYTVGEGNY